MAILSKTGITTGNTVESGHVTQSIDAFSGIEQYDIFLSGSFNMTGSINGEPGVVNNLTSSFSVTASQAISSSFATTASFALNGGGGAAFPFTGSAVITGSLVVTGSTTVNGTLRVNGPASTQAFRVDSNTIASTQTVDVGSSDCLVGGIHTIRHNGSGSITLNLLEPNLYEFGSAWSFTFNGVTPNPDSKIIIQSTPTPPNVTPSPNIWGSIVGFENGTGSRLNGVTLISSSLGGPYPWCRIDLIVNDAIWYVSVVDRYETDWYVAP
jgi:hypothetical protein